MRPGLAGPRTSRRSDPRERAPQGARRPGAARGLLGLAGLALAGLALAGAGAAQQPVVIGEQTPGGGATLGPARPDVVVNEAVLDSLGPGPAPAVPEGAPAPERPPAYGAPAPAPGAPGMASRQAETGQPVVTRPGTLLYPPPKPPRSRLLVPAPERAAAQSAEPAPRPRAARRPELAATGDQQRGDQQRGDQPAGDEPTGDQPRSRLLVPPPGQDAAIPQAPEPAPPVEPVSPAPGRAPESPKSSAEPAAPAPPPMPEPKVGAESPAPPPAPAIDRPGEAAARPELPPPPPPLSEELQAERQTPTPPPAASPPAEGEAGAQPPETQAAALPPAAMGELRLLFEAGSAELSTEAKAKLEGLAQRLAQDSSARVQLLAFAQDTGEGSSRARRLSLSRALAVRAFLIDQGIRSTRMDVRALGSKVEEGPADRVDILPQEAR